MGSYKTVNGKRSCTTKINALRTIEIFKRYKTVNGKRSCTTGLMNEFNKFKPSSYKTVNGKRSCTTAAFKHVAATLRKSRFWKEISKRRFYTAFPENHNHISFIKV